MRLFSARRDKPRRKKFQLELPLTCRKEHDATHTMSNTKKTKVPLPGTKSKSRTQDIPAIAQLSQEFIDSDDNAPDKSTEECREAQAHHRHTQEWRPHIEV
jgi:hypothetical protein